MRAGIPMMHGNERVRTILLRARAAALFTARRRSRATVIVSGATIANEARRDDGMLIAALAERGIWRQPIIDVICGSRYVNSVPRCRTCYAARVAITLQESRAPNHATRLRAR